MVSLWSWAPEGLSIAASGLSLLGLVILLAEYDGKAIFSWHGVNLNAIVSVLSTTSRGLLLLAVDEAVSQWKWILFSRKPRVLKDFAVVDAASRGPLGSLQLLWRLKSSLLIRLGAITILLSLAIDPFSQQLIQLEQKVVYTNDASTTVKRAQRYSKGNEFFMEVVQLGFVKAAFADADYAMQSAILYGLSRSEQAVVQQLDFSCSTGNCTWEEPVRSLAVCSRCTDLSGMLERHNDSGALWTDLMRDNGAAMAAIGSLAYRLPNGLIIDNLNTWSFSELNKTSRKDGTMMTVLGTGDPAQSNSMQDMDTLIWATSMLKVQGVDSSNASAKWPDLPIHASECGLYYCVNEYNSSVVGGNLYEKTHTTAAIRDSASWQVRQPDFNFTQWNITASQARSIVFDSSLSLLGRSDLRLTVGDDYYNISQSAVDSISSFFQNTFAEPMRTYNETNSSGILPGRLNGFYMADEQVQYAPSVSQVLWDQDDTPALFSAIARSMSNAIRDGADAALEQTVTGQTGALVTFYQVQWGWIAIHIVVFAAGLVFLIATIAQSRTTSSYATVPSWRSSALAALNFGAQLGSVFEASDGVRDMERAAAQLQVKLLLKLDNLAGNESNDSLETMIPTQSP